MKNGQHVGADQSSFHQMALNIGDVTTGVTWSLIDARHSVDERSSQQPVDMPLVEPEGLFEAGGMSGRRMPVAGTSHSATIYMNKHESENIDGSMNKCEMSVDSPYSENGYRRNMLNSGPFTHSHRAHIHYYSRLINEMVFDGPK